jgi:ADP-heptose:LPS heptosyltransferase
MKTAYLVRYGAYGDHIYMTNVIRALSDSGYDITMEYNFKGAQIHAHNPLINKKIMYEPFEKKNMNPKEKYIRHHRLGKEKDSHDIFVDFGNSLESALIAPETSSEYFWPLHLRRSKNANVCYYDQSMKWSGLTESKYMGRTGELHFTEKERSHVKTWINKYIPKNKYIVLWGLRGTMYQKAVYPLAEDVIEKFLDQYKDAYVITTGDSFCSQLEWLHERVINVSGKIPFRQALLTADYVDLVVTPETGLGVGAGALGTPKIMLLTSASLQNVVGNDIRDLSLQSTAWCSPCTRAIYNTDHCPVSEETYDFVNEGKINLPICVFFNTTKILRRMDTAYETYGLYNLQRRDVLS